MIKYSPVERVQMKPTRAKRRFALSIILSGAVNLFAAFPAHGDSLTVTVDVAVGMALKNNPRLLQALSEKQASGHSSWQAKTAMLPRGDLQGQYTRTDPGFFPDKSQFITEKQYSATAIASWTPVSAEIWGRMRSAAATAAAAGQTYVASINETAHLARGAFYDALLAARLVEVADQAVQINNEELRRARVQFDVGEVPRLNVLRAEVQLANSVPDLLRAKHNLRIAKADLANIIGYKMSQSDIDGASLVLDGSLSSAPELVSPSIDNLIASAQANRPEVKAAQSNISAASGAVLQSYGGLTPTLSVYSSYTWAHSDNTLRIFSSPTTSSDTAISFELKGWEVGASASMPLFDFLGNRAGVRAANARKRRSEYAADEIRRNIELEVRRAYSSVMEAVESVKSQEKNVESATEAHRLARESQAAGEATQLDVQQAQLDLSKAEALSAEAGRNLLVSQSALITAIGFSSIDDAVSAGAGIAVVKK